MRQHKKFNWFITAVFIVSILINLTFLAIMPKRYKVNENSDYAAIYEPMARNILAGNGFVTKSEITTPPFYPLILAGLFKISQVFHFSEQRVILVFILLNAALASALIFLTAKIIWGNLGGIISSFVWMTYPLNLWMIKQPNSETPFLVVFYGSIYLFLWALINKSNNKFIYFLLGFSVGCAILIRSVVIGLGLVMGVIFLLVRRDIRLPFRSVIIAVLFFGTLTAILPWQWWVYSKPEQSLRLRRYGVLSIRDGLTFAVQRKGYREGVKIPRDVYAMMQDINAHLEDLLSLKSFFTLIKRELKLYPVAVMKLFIIKTLRSWYGTDSQRFENIILPVQIAYLILILLATYAAWHRGIIYRDLVISTGSIVFYFWGINILGPTLVRYMVPVMGVLFILLPALFCCGRYRRDIVNK